MSSNSSYTNFGDEINIKELFFTMWKGRFLIALITLMSIFIGIWYLHKADRTYSVEIVYKLMDEDSGGTNLGGLGGLASLAGVGLPARSNLDFNVFRHLITSEEAAEKIFKNEDLVRNLFIGEFDSVNKTFRNPELDKFGALKRRLKDIITGRDKGVYMPPNPARLAEIVDGAFSMDIDNETGFLIFSAETDRTDLMVELMEAATSAADALSKDRYLESSSNSIIFYQQKLTQARSREHRESLAKLIMVEEKKLMLAAVGKSFVVEPVSRPKVSLGPTSPKAKVVLALSLGFGLFFGTFLVLLRSFLKNYS